MNLLGIEASRIILLMQAIRPLGQVYLPDAIAKVRERYSFVKVPNPDQVVPLTFSIGKFRDSQIAEFSIYNDGFVVTSASNTDLLDAFAEDLLKWAAKELNIETLPGTAPEKFYESTIIVKAESDITSIATTVGLDMGQVFAPAMRGAKISAPLKLTGLFFDFDAKDFLGKRKPFRLGIERRVNVAFSENVFYSQAPFRTEDHIEILTSFEQAALKK